jgi:hypothetical protein
MPESNYEIITIAIFVTIIMFIAHAIPINTKFIEPKLMRAKTMKDKICSYLLALAYYATIIAIALYFSKDLINKVKF